MSTFVHSDGQIGNCRSLVQLTVRDVSGLLNVSEKSVYRWITGGDLPAYRVNGQYRFNRAELLAWATARKVNVSPSIFEEEETEGAMPSLADAVQAGGINYRVSGTDKPSVLRAIVELLRLPDAVDREFLLQVLLARESLASTGVGDGIAIPHVRNPVVLHIDKPTVTLCFLETPVEFGALDGQPVQILFPVISPSVRAHLHLLAQLAFGLRDPELTRLLAEQAGRDAIHACLRRVSSARQGPVPAEAQEVSA